MTLRRPLPPQSPKINQEDDLDVKKRKRRMESENESSYKMPLGFAITAGITFEILTNIALAVGGVAIVSGPVVGMVLAGALLFGALVFGGIVLGRYLYNRNKEKPVELNAVEEVVEPLIVTSEIENAKRIESKKANNNKPELSDMSAPVKVNAGEVEKTDKLKEAAKPAPAKLTAPGAQGVLPPVMVTLTDGTQAPKERVDAVVKTLNNFIVSKIHDNKETEAHAALMSLKIACSLKKTRGNKLLPLQIEQFKLMRHGNFTILQANNEIDALTQRIVRCAIGHDGNKYKLINPIQVATSSESKAALTPKK